MNAAGTAVSRLTEHEVNDFRPMWSPDSARIAFSSKRGRSYDLYFMNADGSNITRLTYTEIHEVNPAWSPDGGRLPFTRVGNETAHYLMDLDSKKETRLTGSSDRDNAVCLSPDGKRIAYLADDGDGMGVYIMEADDSNQVRLMSCPR